METILAWEKGKILTELRFPPSASFFDKKTKILQQLIPIFENYNIDKIDSLAMHTKETPGIDLNLMPNRLIINYEKNTSESDFVSKCQEVWGIVLICPHF